MKFLLCSLGSRGDIEPFLALAEILSARKHEVICVFPEQFRSVVTELNYKFYGFSKEFIETLLRSVEGFLLMSDTGTRFERWRAVWQLIKKSKKINSDIIAKQVSVITFENPDYILAHPKCLIASVKGIVDPQHNITVSPLPCVLHSTPFHSAIGLRGGGDYGSFLNKMSFVIINVIRSVVFAYSTRRYHRELIGKRVYPWTIYRSMLRRQKVFYTISPSLFPQPNSWPSSAHVVGHYERNKKLTFNPTEELRKFLSRHENILFISFGSMSNGRPLEITKVIIDVLSEQNIPAIINTSWGGLTKINIDNQNIYFTSDIPYDYILPKVAAIMHHGGSGTTHMGIKYGCPTLIIPHLVDQFFWNRRVAQLGLGPLGPSIAKLDVPSLRPLILDLMTNSSYKSVAKKLALQMVEEVDEMKLFDKIVGA